MASSPPIVEIQEIQIRTAMGITEPPTLADLFPASRKRGCKGVSHTANRARPKRRLYPQSSSFVSVPRFSVCESDRACLGPVFYSQIVRLARYVMELVPIEAKEASQNKLSTLTGCQSAQGWQMPPISAFCPYFPGADQGDRRAVGGHRTRIPLHTYPKPPQKNLGTATIVVI